MDPSWDGIVSSKALDESANAVRQNLADAAKRFDWERVFAALSDNQTLVNACRPDGSSWYAPLHQVAYAGAHVDVAEKLIRLGAWRTLQNAEGERPIDLAEKRKKQDLIEILAPAYRRRVPNGVLLRIQGHFHGLIRERASELVTRYELRLPELEPLLEFEEGKFWFAVPGMYGGFAYSLEGDGADAMLTSESWCRVVGGSGQRHEIASRGTKLVEEGFV